MKAVLIEKVQWIQDTLGRRNGLTLVQPAKEESKMTMNFPVTITGIAGDWKIPMTSGHC